MSCRRPLLLIGFTVVVMSGLSGCASSRCDAPAPFESAREGEPLSVPSDLEAPQGSGKYDIPEAGRSGSVRGPCGDAPPFSPVTVAEAEPAAGETLGDAAGDAGPLPTTDVPGAVAAAAGAGPIAVSGGIERDIRESVAAWLSAWKQGDGAGLSAFYASVFEPPVDGETRDAWVRRRAELLDQTGPADVRFDRLTVTETFAGARARFIQEFHSRGKIDAVVKTLEFQVEDGRWRIVRERVVEVL
ncbi:MAG: hypothetical protein AAF610_14485 [Pseudomonadota bacterium]